MTPAHAPSRRKLFLTCAASLAAMAVIGVLFAPHMGHALSRASRIPLWQLSLTLVLGVGAIVIRSEIWRLCLRALSGGGETRTDVHACSSMTFLTNQFNHYLGPLARVGLLRRLYGEKAPRPLQLVACDLPVLLCEIGLTAVVLAATVSVAGLPWWLPVAGCGGAVLGLGLLSAVKSRFSGRAAVKGLAILADPRLRLRVTVLMATAITLQLMRTWVLLTAAGLHPAPWQAGLTYVATGVLGTLPLGPATSSGATAAVFAGRATGAAAAGMLLTSSALIAAMLYGGWGLLVLLPRLIRSLRPSRAVVVAPA